jgi:two-component system chemotaxis response regulator CheB
MTASFPVIALVSSAGGLAATRRVLGDLPREFPAAVITLQHTSPDHVSRLPTLLAKVSQLPVVQATDGVALQPKHVFVAPAGYHTLVTPAGRLSLVVSGLYPPSRPSADLLLTTLALAFGSCAVAVVMTGSGHDGATGATAIHKFGGVVLTTDAATSENFAMPAATITRDEIVPAVVPVTGVAAALEEIVASMAVRTDIPASEVRGCPGEVDPRRPGPQRSVTHGGDGESPAT